MKQTRHYGPWIAKAVRTLKKERHPEFKHVEYIWDGIEPGYEVRIQIRIRKKKHRESEE